VDTARHDASVVQVLAYADMAHDADKSSRHTVLLVEPFSRLQAMPNLLMAASQAWQKSQISPSGTLSTVPSIIASMPASPTAAMSGHMAGLSRDISSKVSSLQLSQY
jgi:hypothetical protein